MDNDWTSRCLFGLTEEGCAMPVTHVVRAPNGGGVGYCESHWQEMQSDGGAAIRRLAQEIVVLGFRREIDEVGPGDD